MAELAVVSALASIEHLALPFLSSFNLNEDLREEMQSMKVWLRSMKAFIEDNDGPEGSRRLRDQVEQFRKIAYDIEDVLEEFVRHSPHVFHNHKITQRVHKLAHNVKHGFPLRKISDKIAAIKKSIEDIKSQNDAFAAGGSSSGLRTGGNRVSPLLLDDEIVGYENEKVDFLRQLEVDRKKPLVTLAVAGPGGSGKTTFVQNIWKRGVWGEFDCHAWVHVSRDFDVDKILSDLLKQFCDARKEPCPTDESISIHDKLKKYLADKTYIVVLDDIWSTGGWDSIKGAFPNAIRGSRIIVTTRDSSVASLCASSRRYVYCFDSLAWQDQWKLFCRKAFADNDGECPAELEDCSVLIVKRCEGLPLAIVAVGDALAQKPKLQFEWENFHRNLGCEIGSDSHMSAISNSLLPSYMDLSSNLKSCFLYFSVFPEDYSVQHGRLIRLWVAERFAMGTDIQTAEEVAEEYLNELINRNLVHVSNWDLDGRPRNLRVLNMFHKFIIQKCKDENFAAFLTGDNTTAGNEIRRLSVHGDCTHLLHNTNSVGIRSLLLFRCSHDVLPGDIWKSSSGFQLSRLIDFQGAPLTKFPVDICRLTILRYVCFRDTKIKEIPKSIAKLRYLETLDLKQTDVTELPKEISKLHNLCHLFAYKYLTEKYVNFHSVSGVTVHEGISNLTKLQNLSLVRVDQNGRIVKDLKKLTQLRKLGLLGLKREHGADLCEAINSMEMLTTLDLCSDSKEEYMNLEQMIPPESLRRLYLKGRLTSVPTICSLNNLQRIHLKWSKLNVCPLNGLECLPNLMEIHLVDCYTGEELYFKASTFKKLKILVIEYLSELHTIGIQEGSMPDLQRMSLRRCPNMKILPLGMNSLSKVKELVLHDMADELVDRLKPRSDERRMVEHIPVIHSFNLNNGSWSLENLSSSFYRREVASANAGNS